MFSSKKSEKKRNTATMDAWLLRKSNPENVSTATDKRKFNSIRFMKVFISHYYNVLFSEN